MSTFKKGDKVKRRRGSDMVGTIIEIKPRAPTNDLYSKYLRNQYTVKWSDNTVTEYHLSCGLEKV